MHIHLHAALQQSVHVVTCKCAVYDHTATERGVITLSHMHADSSRQRCLWADRPKGW